MPLHNENTAGATGWCLNLHDLLVAKLVAGREKDLDYIAAASPHGLVDASLFSERLRDTRIDDVVRAVAEQRLVRLTG